jgi:hypothetical protein
MAVNIPPPLVNLLNKVDAGYIVFAHFVPMRIIRVIASENFKTFRVEQLVLSNADRLNPHGAWTTLSTHGSETAGMMLETAMKAAKEAHDRLRGKLVKKMQQRAAKGMVRA